MKVLFILTVALASITSFAQDNFSAANTTISFNKETEIVGDWKGLSGHLYPDDSGKLGLYVELSLPYKAVWKTSIATESSTTIFPDLPYTLRDQQLFVTINGNEVLVASHSWLFGWETASNIQLILSETNQGGNSFAIDASLGLNL